MARTFTCCPQPAESPRLPLYPLASALPDVQRRVLPKCLLCRTSDSAVPYKRRRPALHLAMLTRILSSPSHMPFPQLYRTYDAAECCRNVHLIPASRKPAYPLPPPSPQLCHTYDAAECCLTAPRLR